MRGGPTPDGSVDGPVDGPVDGHDRGSGVAEVVVEEGGEAACWANLVCDVCGHIPDPGEPHHCAEG